MTFHPDNEIDAYFTFDRAAKRCIDDARNLEIDADDELLQLACNAIIIADTIFNSDDSFDLDILICDILELTPEQRDSISPDPNDSDCRPYTR